MTTAPELCGSSAHAHFENKPQVTGNHSPSQKEHLRTWWHSREAKVRSSFRSMLVPWICSGSLHQNNKNPRVYGVLQELKRWQHEKGSLEGHSHVLCWRHPYLNTLLKPFGWQSSTVSGLSWAPQRMFSSFLPLLHCLMDPKEYFCN